MKIGLVGLPGSGKSTVFAAMVKAPAEASAEYGKAISKVIPVPDPRLAALKDIFHPKKYTLSTIEVDDFPGIDAEAIKGNAAMFASMREMDALAVVLRTFADANYPHARPEPDASRDWESVMTDFQIADLEMIERRIERLAKSASKPTKTQDRDKKELALLQKCQETVEGGGRLAQVHLKAGEDELLAGFRFLTMKPVMVVLNLADDASGDEIEKAFAGRAEQVVSLRGRLECEIAQLDADEAAEFMADFAITEPASNAMIRGLYDLLGLQSFFTVGPDEVRAWTIVTGDNAVTAASKIHSDIARGFIRAEVMPYESFIDAGSEKAAKDAGIMRLEGKEYAVADGDIINFRFSV